MHLVEQHAKEEFHVLQGTFRVMAISGDSSHKCFFSQVVKRSDVVICTAQILHNALLSREEDTRVELTGGHGTPMAGTPPRLGHSPGWDISPWLGPPRYWDPPRHVLRCSPRSPPSPRCRFLPVGD